MSDSNLLLCFSSYVVAKHTVWNHVIDIGIVVRS